jgi:hypothetical protein
MSIRSVKSILAAGALALAAAAPAHATLYSDSFQGVTFNINATNGGSSFTFDIVVGTLSGDWVGISAVAGIGFKDLGIDFGAAGVSATITPPGVAGSNSQIAAGLCGSGSPPGSICFGGSTYPGLNVALTVPGTTSFTIDITGATLNIASGGPHLQIAFMDALNDTDKLGSLYSQNIPVTTSNGGGDVPEPATSALLLLGFGLLGIGFAARRRAQHT